MEVFFFFEDVFKSEDQSMKYRECFNNEFLKILRFPKWRLMNEKVNV